VDLSGAGRYPLGRCQVGPTCWGPPVGGSARSGKETFGSVGEGNFGFLGERLATEGREGSEC
jgi:hypothetical protein